MKVYKNIAIGGTGFIGSALCLEIKKEGENVLSVSNVKKNGLGFDNKHCDVRQKDKLKSILKGAENIFILIGQINSDFSKEQELKNIKNVIECIDVKSARKVFYFSSSLVYGDIKKGAKEADKPKPMDNYSQFKVESEELIKNKLNKNIILIILRLSNVYGNHKNRGFIGLVFKNIFENPERRIILNGDGMQSRDYVLIDDVVKAITTIKDKAEENDTVNICTGESHSLIEILEEISKITAKKINFSISGEKDFGMKSNSVSNEKLVSKYGYDPKYMLTDGLRMTFERYYKFYNNSNE